MSFTYKPSHNIVEVNFTPETGVAVGTSRRSLKSFPPFGDTIVITPTRKDKAHSFPIPKGGGIPHRFDERVGAQHAAPLTTIFSILGAALRPYDHEERFVSGRFFLFG